jgi:hypothetical protein
MLKRLLIALLLAAAPVAAEEHPALAEVLDGATSMASPAPGFLMVVRPDGAFLCGLNLNPNYFAARADGRAADFEPPAAICIPAADIENLGD